MTPSARYPWLLIGLLWMVAFLNAADRSILFTVMPQLKTEFGLTATQLALLNSVFFWVYAVCAFLSGSLGDKSRRSRVIIYGLLFWSVATGIVSLSTGFAMLLGLRASIAICSAVIVSSSRQFDPIDQPMIRREYRSKITARYNQPSNVHTLVTSPTHTASADATVNCRSKRFG